MLDADEQPARAVTRRSIASFAIACLCFSGLTTPAWAQNATPSVKVGAGARVSVFQLDVEDDDEADTQRFLLDSLRLYFSGPITQKLSFMVNTEYNGAGNDVEVMDAAAQFSFSEKFNVWAGRFLPPSDRANLYGPYYAHHWGVYTDSVQDGYPFIFQGRANGAMYWGQFGKVKVSGGAFDGASMTPDDTLVGAGRVQIDFLDPEPGYYLNGTFYGDKNILAIGIAGQTQGSEQNAYSFDFLYETKMSPMGAFSVEAEWARYDQLGGYNPNYGLNDGGYVLGSYLFPQLVGPGRFEVLGKFAHASFRHGRGIEDFDFDQDTTELNFNYIIKQFDARVMMFYRDTRFDAVNPNTKVFGVGLQVQM